MSTEATQSGQDESATLNPRRWKALAVLGLIQFMLVLDITVVNVALPRIQADLGFSGPGLAWVVNGYALMGGGLLLLGGRLADVFGRRRLFLIGVAVFGVTSAICGAALTPAMLVSGRFVQGAGEAMAAPASLGLVVMLFPDLRERMRAVGIWGGLTALGGASGVLISGVLTDLASWRWIFYINLPVAAVALILVPLLVSESRMTRVQQRLNFLPALIATGGLVAIVYGLLQAVSHPWGSWQVLLPLFGGLALVAAMIGMEARSRTPLIPLRFFTNRTRVTANLVTLFVTSAFVSYFFMMTLFMQQVLGYSPLRNGLSYLPVGIGLGLGIGVATSLMPRLGVRPLAAVGFFGGAVAMLLTSMIDVETSYPTGILPGMIVLAVFTGLTFPTITNAALHQTTGQDASLASGVQVTMQQIGSATGLALLVTIALRHAQDRIGEGVLPQIAATDGYVLSFRVAAGLLIVGGILILVLFEQVKAQAREVLAEVELGPDHADPGTAEVPEAHKR